MTFDEFCDQWMRERTETIIGRVPLTDDLVARIRGEFQAVLRRVYPYPHDVSVNMDALDRGEIAFQISRPVNIIRDFPDVNATAASLEFAAFSGRTIPSPLANARNAGEVEAAVRNLLDAPPGSRLPRVELGSPPARGEEIAIMVPPLQAGAMVRFVPVDHVPVDFTGTLNGFMCAYREGVAYNLPAGTRMIRIINGRVYPVQEGFRSPGRVHRVHASDAFGVTIPQGVAPGEVVLATHPNGETSSYIMGEDGALRALSTQTPGSVSTREPAKPDPTRTALGI